MHPNGDRGATAREAAFCLELDKEHIERAGLTFAEPGDPDGFLVKWKARGRDRERIESGTVERLGHVLGEREVEAGASPGLGNRIMGGLSPGWRWAAFILPGLLSVV